MVVSIRHNLVGAVDWLVSSIVLCDSVECRARAAAVPR